MSFFGIAPSDPECALVQRLSECLGLLVSGPSQVGCVLVFESLVGASWRWSKFSVPDSCSIRGGNGRLFVRSRRVRPYLMELLPTPAAARALCRSPQYPKRLWDSRGGFLVLGKHYFQAPSRNAAITWDLQAVNQALGILSALPTQSPTDHHIFTSHLLAKLRIHQIKTKLKRTNRKYAFTQP